MKEENYSGYYDILKKPIVNMLKDYRKSFIEMRGFDMRPIDFDNWVAGVFSGLTLNKSELDTQTTGEKIKALKKLSDFIVKSGIAKDIGVTGTEKEEFKVLEH
jgi:hypothetical protein